MSQSPDGNREHGRAPGESSIGRDRRTGQGALVSTGEVWLGQVRLDEVNRKLAT